MRTCAAALCGVAPIGSGCRPRSSSSRSARLITSTSTRASPTLLARGPASISVATSASGRVSALHGHHRLAGAAEERRSCRRATVDVCMACGSRSLREWRCLRHVVPDRRALQAGRFQSRRLMRLTAYASRRILGSCGRSSTRTSSGLGGTSCRSLRRLLHVLPSTSWHKPGPGSPLRSSRASRAASTPHR